MCFTFNQHSSSLQHTVCSLGNSSKDRTKRMAGDEREGRISHFNKSLA